MVKMEILRVFVLLVIFSSRGGSGSLRRFYAVFGYKPKYRFVSFQPFLHRNYPGGLDFLPGKYLIVQYGFLVLVL